MPWPPKAARRYVVRPATDSGWGNPWMSRSATPGVTHWCWPIARSLLPQPDSGNGRPSKDLNHPSKVTGTAASGSSPQKMQSLPSRTMIAGEPSESKSVCATRTRNSGVSRQLARCSRTFSFRLSVAHITWPCGRGVISRNSPSPRATHWAGPRSGVAASRRLSSSSQGSSMGVLLSSGM